MSAFDLGGLMRGEGLLWWTRYQGDEFGGLMVIKQCWSERFLYVEVGWIIR